MINLNAMVSERSFNAIKQAQEETRIYLPLLMGGLYLEKVIQLLALKFGL